MAERPFRINPRQRDQLRGLLDPILQEKAEQIAATCNRQSSWGGYVAVAEEGRAIVHTTGHALEEDARHQRLLRALHAARSSR